MTDICPLDSDASSVDPSLPPIIWRKSDQPVAYADAIDFMESHVAAIRAGSGGEMVWLLEHPPVYTAGTSARAQDLLQPDRFPVHEPAQEIRDEHPEDRQEQAKQPEQPAPPPDLLAPLTRGPERFFSLHFARPGSPPCSASARAAMSPHAAAPRSWSSFGSASTS